MMKYNRIFITIVATLALNIWAQAQSHWSCDTHAFMYDMTAYVQVVVDGIPVNDYSDYEIAAMVDGECRGVAQTVNATRPYGLIRIRSNEAQGELVNFSVYKSSTTSEINFEDVVVEFQSQGIAGLPSNPIKLKIGNDLKGDVDGDGSVGIADVVALIDYLLSNDDEGIVLELADIDGDGDIGIADVIELIDLIINS